MAWKLLRLKPLKPFFFGSQTVFTNTNYAASEYFPQQTQITGALRRYWMERNKLLKRHKNGTYCAYEQKQEALGLVGDAGSLDFRENDNLGRIKSISPMFVLHTENENVLDVLFEIPHDIVDEKNQYKPLTAKKLPTILSSSDTVLLEGYDVKEGMKSGFGGRDFWDAYVQHKSSRDIHSHNEIFEVYEQVGIALTADKQTEENKFYTKKSYMLKNKYEFGILFNIEDDDLIPEKRFKDGMLTLGGEGSVFSIKVSDVPESFTSHKVTQSLMNNTLSKKGTKIVLLSDSMLAESIADEAYFQIVKHKVPFRMMVSHEVKSNDILGEIAKQPKTKQQSHQKTQERLLTPRGSVYYFDSMCSLEEAKSAYKKMGFNTYLSID